MRVPQVSLLRPGIPGVRKLILQHAVQCIDDLAKVRHIKLFQWLGRRNRRDVRRGNAYKSAHPDNRMPAPQPSRQSPIQCPACDGLPALCKAVQSSIRIQELCRDRADSIPADRSPQHSRRFPPPPFPQPVKPVAACSHRSRWWHPCPACVQHNGNRSASRSSPSGRSSLTAGSR